MRRALAQPDMKAKLTDVGVDIRTMTPDELAAYQRTERAKWGKIVEDSGAKLD